jgi:hypothetical protein
MEPRQLCPIIRRVVKQPNSDTGDRGDTGTPSCRRDRGAELRPSTVLVELKPDSPGSTELHLIPIGPSAIAQLSMRLLTPALVGV